VKYAQLDKELTVEEQKHLLIEFMELVEEREAEKQAAIRVNISKTDTHALTTSFTRIPGMDAVFRSHGGVVLIFLRVALTYATGTSTVTMELRVDGIPVGKDLDSKDPSGQNYSEISVPVQLSEGLHKIEAYAMQNSGSNSINGTTGQKSSLHVVEIRV